MSKLNITNLAKVARAIERLQEGVHVAGCTLVLQPHVTRLLFGVVAFDLMSKMPLDMVKVVCSLDKIVP